MGGNKKKRANSMGLTAVDKKDYPKDTYYNHILEQYKLYAQILDDHHNRFMNTLKYFISIQIIFFSGFGIIIKNEVDLGLFGTLMFLITTLSICGVWLLITRSHYKLTTAKHETLEDMEFYLPLKPFHYEWHDKLNLGKSYLSMRTVFFVLPIVLSIIYLSLTIIVLTTY